MAEDDHGDNGAKPDQISTGVVGRHLSEVDQALLRGGHLQARKGHHFQVEPLQWTVCQTLHRWRESLLPPSLGAEGTWSISKSQGCTPGHREKTGSLPLGRLTLA